MAKKGLKYYRMFKKGMSIEEIAKNCNKDIKIIKNSIKSYFKIKNYDDYEYLELKILIKKG